MGEQPTERRSNVPSSANASNGAAAVPLNTADGEETHADEKDEEMEAAAVEAENESDTAVFINAIPSNCSCRSG